MREYIGFVRNLSLSVRGEKLLPVAELIVITSEPRYTVDETGSLVASRVTEALRFVATVEGLRDLIGQLEEVQDELERTQVTATAVERPAPEPPTGAK